MISSPRENIDVWSDTDREQETADALVRIADIKEAICRLVHANSSLIRHAVGKLLLSRRYHAEQVLREAAGMWRGKQRRPPIDLPLPIRNHLDTIAYEADRIARMNVQLKGLNVGRMRVAESDHDWPDIAHAAIARAAEAFDPSSKNQFSTLAVTNLKHEATRIFRQQRAHRGDQRLYRNDGSDRQYENPDSRRRQHSMTLAALRGDLAAALQQLTERESRQSLELYLETSRLPCGSSGTCWASVMRRYEK